VIQNLLGRDRADARQQLHHPEPDDAVARVASASAKLRVGPPERRILNVPSRGETKEGAAH
jgi:hypothetical protein